jgi:beta-lactamase regulating signal transducer with metallopeptidase domain
MSVMVILKVTIAFALALGFTLLARRGSAALRHAVLVAGQLAALSIPLLSAVVPPLVVNVRSVRPRPAVASPAPAIETDQPGITAPRTPRGGNVLLGIWLAGCTLVAGSKLTAIARAAMIVWRATRFGEVRFTGELEQPSTFFHCILLPRNARVWSEARLGPVLLHEQAHVARRDTLLGLIGDAACAVYWFHPLAWLVARLGRLERERACDDLVLARGIVAEHYAATMIEVARSVVRRNAAAMPMAESSQLRQRIRAILDPAIRRRTSAAGAAAMVVVMLGAAPLLAALTPSAAFARPKSIEPDLLGDAVASPMSERLDPVLLRRDVRAAGPDAALIALLLDAAELPKRSSDDFVAERARWALAQIRGGELVPPLIEALRDRDWRVRAYAAWALGHSGDARATRPLIALLDSPVWRVRAMAAHALANLGDPRAEGSMLALVDDDAWQVRVEVVRYLAAIGSGRDTIAAMKDDRHIAVRSAAAEALRSR